MKQPIAVIINDVHYSLQTLELADKVTRMAIAKAFEKQVPLIIAGDLHDTKANWRAECMNAMVKTFNNGILSPNDVYIMVGNHDRINEKSPEHSLNFLKEYATIVDQPCYKPYGLDLYLIPYNHNTQDLTNILTTIPKGSMIVMHQGLQSASPGDYIQDHSAITKQDVAGFRVVSGHYHNRQTIKLPDNGVWDYLGNPYTLNYAEATDPPKGYHILYNDGSLEFIHTCLRKHIVYKATYDELYSYSNPPPAIQPNDLVWVKITGSQTQLATLSKDMIIGILGCDFKLELIPNEIISGATYDSNKLPNDALDDTIEVSNLDSATKIRLKSLWKELIK